VRKEDVPEEKTGRDRDRSQTSKGPARREILSVGEVLERHLRHALPAVWHMIPPEPCGVRVSRGEIFEVERDGARPGDAICLVSGKRLAWRRALAVRDGEALVRADVAPFADGWFGYVVGRLRPRPVDRLAAIAPARWAELGWVAAHAGARAFAVYRRLLSRAQDVPTFSARSLADADWPRVRAFWLEACGDPLPLHPQPSQHVVGLFLPTGALAGVNIQLVLGDTSYSAFTLVDRRYRGLGGGRQMIEVALRVTRELGVKLVYVHIHALNLPSIAAYEAVGFRFARWWTEDSDPLLAAERQWCVFERVP
jgi:GNAT superfamily N-acetyltransferase